MSVITSSLRHLQAAPTSLPSLLDAALLAFEEMLTEIRLAQDPTSPLFAALTMAAAAAADGRDALLFAPSLPPSPASPAGPEPGASGDVGESATSEVAELCMTLASRLDYAAAAAVVPGDHRACNDAARHARDIRDLLAGTLP